MTIPSLREWFFYAYALARNILLHTLLAVIAYVYIMLEKLEYVKGITCEDVFQAWKENEAEDAGWIHCATVIKGWEDWESWRRNTLTVLGAENMVWKLYTIRNVEEVVPNMLIGPFNGWQARVTRKNKTSFEEMLAVQENFDFYAHHGKVLDIMNHFPEKAWMTGVYVEETDKIVCIEGHHRATAVALAKKQGKKMDIEKGVCIALATLPKGQEDVFDRMLEQGTSKPV